MGTAYKKAVAQPLKDGSNVSYCHTMLSRGGSYLTRERSQSATRSSPRLSTTWRNEGGNCISSGSSSETLNCHEAGFLFSLDFITEDLYADVDDDRTWRDPRTSPSGHANGRSPVAPPIARASDRLRGKRPVSGSPRRRRVTLMRPSCSRPVTRKRHRKAGLFYTARTNNAVSTLANAHSFSRFSRK
jgi:hypothetical protein